MRRSFFEKFFAGGQKTTISGRVFSFRIRYTYLVNRKKASSGRKEGDGMRQVILSMKDYIFADAVASTLRKDPKSDFAVQTTSSPEEIVQ